MSWHFQGVGTPGAMRAAVAEWADRELAAFHNGEASRAVIRGSAGLVLGLCDQLGAANPARALSVMLSGHVDPYGCTVLVDVKGVTLLAEPPAPANEVAATSAAITEADPAPTTVELAGFTPPPGGNLVQ